jgi:hypothetical protein
MSLQSDAQALEALGTQAIVLEAAQTQILKQLALLQEEETALLELENAQLKAVMK